VSGRSAGVSATRQNHRELVWLDRAGQKVADGASPANYIHPWLSPDEKRAVVEVVDPENGAHAVWMLDLVRGSRKRFVAGPATSHFPIWSADGRSILFSSDRSGPWSLFARDSTGTGADEALLTLPTSTNATDWSRDGRFVIYQTSQPGTRSDVWALPVTPPVQPFPVANGAGAERQGNFPRGVGGVRVRLGPRRCSSPTDKWTVSLATAVRRVAKSSSHPMDVKLMAADVHTTSSSLDRCAEGSPTGEPLQCRNNFMPSADGQRFLVKQTMVRLRCSLGRGHSPPQS
jgi:hypothetical protein